MVLELYTGFPGSGKSYAATRDGTLVADSMTNKYVIANFPIKAKRKFFHFLKKKEEDKYNNPRWIYKTNEELTVRYLVNKSKKMGWIGKEGSCLVIFDEASIPFNSRDWSKSDRLDWVKFLSQHRKFGYDFIMITQDANMIDKQIRALAEYETVFRKLNNSSFLRWLSIFRVSVFMGARYWNGMKYGRAKAQFYMYKKSVADRYDTSNLFDYDEEFDVDELPEVSE